MINVFYGLCALTSFLCAWLLLQAWRRSQYSPMLWGGVCFAGLTLNNITVIIDKFVLTDVDLLVLRNGIALASMAILLYGLIWDSE